MRLFAFWKAAAGGGGTPSLTSLNYSLGDTAGGGQSIVVTGTNLGSASAVTIGGNSATITGNTSTTVTFTLPAHAAGAVTVSVTTPGGTSGTLAFEYWTPSQLTGADLYFDSNKGVTGSAPITSWVDQKNTVSATAASSPSLQSSIFGSLPAVRFSPQAQFTLAGRQDASYDAGISVFWVAKWTATRAVITNPYGCVPLSIFGYATGWPAAGASAGNIAYNFNGSTTVGVRGSGLNDGNPHLCGITYVQSTNAMKAYKGATQQGTTDTGTSYPAAGNVGIDTLCNGNGATDGWDGDVGAIVVCKGATVVTGTDLTKLDGWASQRFGAV